MMRGGNCSHHHLTQLKETERAGGRGGLASALSSLSPCHDSALYTTHRGLEQLEGYVDGIVDLETIGFCIRGNHKSHHATGGGANWTCRPSHLSLSILSSQ